MFETSYLTINKSAYQKNLKFIQNQIGENVQFCSVIKGNAYGHGIDVFAKMAIECGVNYFGVYSANEAYKLKKSIHNNVSIMIMGMVEGTALEWAIDEGIEFFVFDFERLKDAVEIAQKKQTKAIIHLEIETGMNRTGFTLETLKTICDYIKINQEFIELKGICTHYAGSESFINNERVRSQISNFEKAKQEIALQGFDVKYTHSACSAAMMNYPETIGNMVRIGIMQYGFWPNEETLIRYNGQVSESDKVLKRLLEWKSEVMSVKDIAKGEFIGYNSSFQAYKDMRIAVIPVGYGYGYNRSLSNTGKVLIHGEEAPVCGIINMNAMCVDISHLENVKKTDEVILIGNQGDASISVASFGEMSNQLNYELLTRLPQDIPRKIK